MEETRNKFAKLKFLFARQTESYFIRSSFSVKQFT